MPRRLVLLSLLAVACNQPAPAADCPPPAEPAVPETPPVAERPEIVSLDAVVWMQKSVEYDAVATTTYKAAQAMLDRALADETWTAALEQGEDFAKKTPAVVLDVDETCLDNSPYAAWRMEKSEPYAPESWNKWCDAASAEPIPGALAFTKYAAEKGVDVFFVTNRDAAVEAGTLENLLAHGFPVDEAGERLMLKGEKPEWTGEKGSRRQAIAADHRIVMLVGDNLGDFVDGAKTSAEERAKIYEQHADKWGERWFMIPNPDYGTWEHPIAGKPGLDAGQRRDAKLEALDDWPG